MTSQRTLKQFYQRFKVEHALLLATQLVSEDSLYVTMDMIRVMYAYFLWFGTGQEQRALLELKARPELVRVKAFFDEYQWNIDDQVGEYSVQPDVLGYVFEQQINQKQLGAYYTQGDIAEYIAQRTVLPYLLDAITSIHPTVIAPLQAQLLRTQPERYIHAALSSQSYLPTETEREYTLRQARYKQLYTRLQQGQLCTVTDVVTYNLDIRRLALNIITTCTQPQLLLTVYNTLERMTILDPTCGTGAFLLAAMTLLEELYRVCLQRMQQFIERWDERCETSDTCYAVFHTLLTRITVQGIGELLVHNLYGIEIMPEAAEVCAMRLSLMLVRVPRLWYGMNNEYIPPWNIHAGNALTSEMWQAAFPGQYNGFDVIIGNPPFVEYSRMTYEMMPSDGNGTYGNLYAEVVERSLSLCYTAHSYIGFVVPLSLCGGKRFDRLRRTLLRNTSLLWLANFDIFPCRLFEGAYQRVTLLLGKCNRQCTCTNETYVTSIQRWYTSERSTLIERIVYTRVHYEHRKCVFPKLGSWLQEEIVQKMIAVADRHRLSMLVSPRKTEYAVYYQEATNTWMKATRHIPYYKKNNVVTQPRHGRFLYFEDNSRASIVCALMNSSLFYLWFATYSDGFHLSNALVQNFPIPYEVCADKQLLSLAQRLEEDIQKHVLYSTRNTKTGDRIEIEEYRMACSKPIIDEIDDVLAKYYCFTHEELDIILYYDYKYRMGRAEYIGYVSNVEIGKSIETKRV